MQAPEDDEEAAAHLDWGEEDFVKRADDADDGDPPPIVRTPEPYVTGAGDDDNTGRKDTYLPVDDPYARPPVTPSLPDFDPWKPDTPPAEPPLPTAPSIRHTPVLPPRPGTPQPTAPARMAPPPSRPPRPVPPTLPVPSPHYARAEHILSQWTRVDMLKRTTVAQVGEEAAYAIIEAGIAALSHNDPHDTYDPVHHELFAYQREVGNNQFFAGTLLEHMANVDDRMHIHAVSPPLSTAAFCASIQPRLAELLQHPRQQGQHASLLFAAIHGRLLARDYTLPVAPDVPGAFLPSTRDGVLQSYAMRLMGEQADIFTFHFWSKAHPGQNAWAVDSVTQGAWYDQLAREGGLGLGCQLFTRLPLRVIGFWSYLSDRFFGNSLADEEFKRRIIIDEQPTEYMDEEGDFFKRSEIDETNAPAEDKVTTPVLEQHLPIVTQMFFTPPFADIQALRAYVIGRLKGLVPKDDDAFAALPQWEWDYVLIMSRLLRRLDKEHLAQEEWDAMGDYMQKVYLKPTVQVDTLYRELRRCVSAADVAARLQRLLVPRAYQTLRGPTRSRQIYNQLMTLEDYAPNPHVVKERLRVLQQMREVGDVHTYMEQVVWRQAVWQWPAPTHAALNQRVVEILLAALGLMPEGVKAIFLEPDAPLPGEEGEEINAEGEGLPVFKVEEGEAQEPEEEGAGDVFRFTK